MEQQLIPTLYTQINATNKHTLKAVQGSQKQKQHSFFAGDTFGYIYNFEFQKGQLQQIFKSQQNSKEINFIQSYNQQQDIYYATGTQIKGINKKGKEIFKGETHQTEPIRNFIIDDNIIWTTGQYLVNKFEINNNDLKETSYYQSPEKINYILIGNYTGEDYQTIIASSDNHLKILQEDTVLNQIDTNSQITHIIPYKPSYQIINSCKEAPKTMLCGTQNGELIYIDCKVKQKKIFLEPLWTLKGNSEACIRIFNSFDFQKNGLSDVLLAREDSTLEWWGCNINGELEIIWEKQFNESINGVEGGYFVNQETSEFIISSFSGKIIGFQDTLSKFKNIDEKQVAQNLDVLQQEIKKLEQTALELEQNINNNQSISKGAFGNEKTFKLNYKIEILVEDASYNLYLDSELGIELAAFQSDLKIEIVEFNNKISVKGSSPDDNINGNYFLETYRVIEQSINKLEFKLRTYEGKQGEIKVFVIPYNYSNNAQILVVPIKPLSMHVRSNQNIKEDSQFNSLEFIGDFSKNDMHTWIMLMINEVPVNYEDESVLVFKNALVGSTLFCKYQAGKACFKSDSISTICIIKDFVNKEINQRGLNVSVKWDVNDNSVLTIFELLKPQFEQHKKNNVKCKIIPALKELKLSEQENSFMSDELKQILANGDELLKQFQNLPKKIEYLKGIISDL
ncbi:hypothetical protein IMG5_115940, partial [Ichthyophthirius multifiliis]